MDYNEMMQRNAEAIENAINKLTPTMVTLQNSINAVGKLYSRMEKIINPTIIAVNKVLDEIVPTVNESVEKCIPNLRAIDNQYKALSKSFCTAVEQLMRTLDFPVVQPVITEKQLEERLEQMDAKTIIKVESLTIEIINAAPISKSRKTRFKEMVKKGFVYVVIPFLIGTTSGISGNIISNWILEKNTSAESTEYMQDKLNDNGYISCNDTTNDVTSMNDSAPVATPSNTTINQ